MSVKVFKEYVRNVLFWMESILISDRQFNISRFKKEFGRNPDLENPCTFSEKLLYLKLHYNNLLQNVCADKYTVRQYVECCGYSTILNKLYAVYQDPTEINLATLPEKFFIQCSHTQGFNYVIEKTDSQRLKAVQSMYRCIMKRKHFWGLRENCYKHIKPRILCSEYLCEPGRGSLTDYKFYCFDGKARYFMVSYGEYNHNVKNHKFDMEWNSIDHLFKTTPAINAQEIERPDGFEKMVEIAETLSAPFPHVRVDLYNIEGRIVFGEMTFYSAGGFVHVASESMDQTIGSWINLQKHKNWMS